MPGVYISWPFCAQKCTYCNFASGVYSAAQQTRYLDALSRQLQQQVWPWTPETVYLGGGTPSLMGPDQLQDVLARIPGAPWSECTMEAAPGSLDPSKVRAWQSLGINRVSLGVQSFVTTELRQTGRRHTAEIVAADCALLREAGIPNLNLDLIAGLPYQTAASWQESLEWIERLAPPHVSVYMLEVDEDSRLGLEILGEGGRYGAGAVPQDDVIVGNYQHAVEALAAMGIPRYEISNFARPGQESRHNLKYWRMEPYFGFGVDAHSCDGHHRWGSPDGLAEYLTAVEGNHPLEVDSVPVRPLEERFLTGLRLDEGLPWRPQDTPPAVNARIQQRIDQGLLTYDGKLRLTPRGVLLSNEVFADFLGADDPSRR